MCTLEEFIDFIKNAPSTFTVEEKIKKLVLPNGGAISCVRWGKEFYISGTDVIRCVTYRFEALGRTVRNVKKFEEGVFSDLRNLKPGLDASLQEPHSELLRFLHRHQCIRTQKKQKVFYWHSVPHNRMFAEAIEREIKRDALGHECTTFVPSMTDLDQFSAPYSLSSSFSAPQSDSRSTSQDSSHDSFCSMTYDQPMFDFYSSADQSSSFDTSQALGSNFKLWDVSIPPLFDDSMLLSFNAVPFYSQPKEQHNFFSQGLQSMEPSSMSSFSASSSTDVSFSDANLFHSPSFLSINLTDTAYQSRPKMHHCTYPSCTRKFKRCEHLRRHILSHTGHRPFLCPIVSCQRPFSRKDNLAQHIKTHRF
ncbi:hypothetical protein DSO57_1032706 [Entomophthora muscae]|uniref:Uncharacterized protein n=1 Tax=Entomophthora muscae TaxID=34485 RepID=A0ACC2TBC9_9FUNG|nr:hypothetical protein DSO57_1032706 [Entomophthora muscae]